MLREIKTGFVYDELEIPVVRTIVGITVSESRDRLCIAYRDSSDVHGGLINVAIDAGQRFLKADMVDTALNDAPMKFFEDFYGSRTVLSCYNSIMLLNSKDLQIKRQTDVAFNGVEIQIAVDRNERYIAVSQTRNDTTVFDVYDTAINDVLHNFFETAQSDSKYQRLAIKGLSFSDDDKLYYGVIRELKMIDLSGQTFNKPTLAAISALSGKEVDEASYRTSNRTGFDVGSALIYTSDDWANKLDAYISEYSIGGTSQKVEILKHKLRYGL